MLANYTRQDEPSAQLAVQVTAPSSGTALPAPLLAPVARSLQNHDVSINHGSFAQSGRDVNINTHYHYHSESTPFALSLSDVLRKVPNLRGIYLDMLSKATQGTGQWLLISKDYLLWLDSNGSLKILWGSGIRRFQYLILALN